MVVVRLFADIALCRFEARPGFDFDEALANFKADVPVAIWRDSWWQVKGGNRMLMLAHLFRRFEMQRIDLEVISEPGQWQFC